MLMLFGVQDEPIGRPGMFIRIRASGRTAGGSAGAITPASLTGSLVSATGWADGSGAVLTGSLVSAAGSVDDSGAVLTGSLVSAAGSVDDSGAVLTGSLVSAAGSVDFSPLPTAPAGSLVSATADSLVSATASASPPAAMSEFSALATPVYTQDMSAIVKVTARGRVVPCRFIAIPAIPARPTA
jgi:hypothetical protein